MFRSSAVPYLKPSSLRSKFWIFGIGYGCRLIRLFSSRKSEMKRTVPSFFGTINVGAPHWDLLTCLRTLSSHKRSNSDLKVSSWIFGTGNGWAWWGSTCSFNLMSYGVPVNVPSVPSNRSSYFFRSLSNDSYSLLVRWSAFAAISSRFASLYFASRMSVIRCIFCSIGWYVRYKCRLLLPFPDQHTWDSQEG